MSLLSHLSKLTKRTGLPVLPILRILGFFYSKKLPVSASPVHLSDPADPNLAYIQSMLPAQHGNTCICETHHTISAEYDLHIIVPVYNVEDYIVECIDSIVSQSTRYSFFVTIVNDGSTDHSRKLLQRYEQYDNLQIIDQENRGLSGARNRGLEQIKGKYVTFIDSDDMLLPGAIEALMKAALTTDADIVEGGYDALLPTGRKPVLKHRYEVLHQWYGKLYGFAWGKVYKSTLWKRLRFPEGYWFEDTIDSFIVFPSAKVVVTIPATIYLYRKFNDGITSISVGKPKSVDSILVTLQVLEDATRLHIPFDHQVYQSFLRQTLLNARRISRIGNKELNHHLFAIHCRIFHQYFTSFPSESPDLQFIAHSFLHHDYARFLLASIFL